MLSLKEHQAQCSKTSVQAQGTKIHWHHYSDQGMKLDPDKAAAITQMPPPEKKAVLPRFISLVNFYEQT